MTDLQQLRETILKDGKVTKGSVTFSQKIYSNNTESPVSVKSQEVVEIGIDDLMQAITATIEAEVARGKLEQTVHLQVAEQKFGKVDWKAAIYELEPREKMT